MPSRAGKDTGNKGKWLKIVLTSPPELVDAPFQLCNGNGR
jgi:ribosomal protein L11 methyltransferase